MKDKEHLKALNRERSRRWRKSHPKRKKEQAQKWLDKNPEYYSDYYKDNAEHVKERVKIYNLNNPSMKRESDRRRRVKKYKTRGEIYTEKEVIELWGTNCYICSQPIDFNVSGRPGYKEGWENGLNVDHVIPFIAGGTDTLDNVRPTHAICNLKKHASIIESITK